MLYQKRLLAGMVDVGEPGPLPADLVGLADVSLADLGWTYEPLGYRGFGFFPVLAPVVPATVTQLQFRRALRLAGIKATVDAFIAAQDEETVEAWEYASEFRRDSPLLNAAAGALYGDDGPAQLDALFLAAQGIVE
jgi:hypothetical protein